MPNPKHLRIICLPVLACISQFAFCQDEPNPVKVTWESAVLGSPEAFVQLRDSLTEIEYMIDKDEETPAEQSINLDRMIERIEFGKRRLAAAVESESALNDRSKAVQFAQTEKRFIELRQELESVKHELKELSSEIELPKVALEQMSQKIGEAIIANRLRELESRALIEALKVQAEEQQHSPLHDSKVKLAERRYALATKRLAQARELAKRSMVSKHEVDELELAELEALATLDEVRSGADVNDSISRKIAEAVTDQIVSTRMQKLLAEESAKLNEKLGKASGLPILVSEASQLTKEMSLLRNQQWELEHQSETDDKNLMRATMLLKQVSKTLERVKSQKAKPSESE